MRASTIIRASLGAVSAILSMWFAASSFKHGSEVGSHFLQSRFHIVQNVFVPAEPSAVKLSGFLGKRYEANVNAWLLQKNEDSLLACFTHRPSSYGWQGEHVGKWIAAATLAWANSRNVRLREKLDVVVKTLLRTQLPDGYLGTYQNNFHWAMGKELNWDVWVHKYNLLGLITYARYTGDQQALDAAKGIADLLNRTFGAGGKLSLNKRSTFRGLASGSVLEPIVLLYRVTNDVRYLQFALYIVDQWEQPEGSHIITSLTKGAAVNTIGSGKAYEMLSCLNGLCELFRATADQRFLTPVLKAWTDIVENQLLPTGSGSIGEYWRNTTQCCDDTGSGFAEVCVTINWLQLNEQLLALTGKACYADEIEKTLYNHLAAAQKPDGSAWSYFTNLHGKKAYTNKQTCCSSSGPRGWASVPSFVYMRAEDGVVVNLFTQSEAMLTLPSGDSVKIQQETNYPISGTIHLMVSVSKPAEWTLRVRISQWSHLSGGTAQPGGFYSIHRRWVGTTPITIRLDIPARFEHGKHPDGRYAAIARGPQILAFDEHFNPSIPKFDSVWVDSSSLDLTPSQNMMDEDNFPVYSIQTKCYFANNFQIKNSTPKLFLSPFSSAGTKETSYDVWLPTTAQ